MHRTCLDSEQLATQMKNGKHHVTVRGRHSHPRSNVPAVGELVFEHKRRGRQMAANWRNFARNRSSAGSCLSMPSSGPKPSGSPKAPIMRQTEEREEFSPEFAGIPRLGDLHPNPMRVRFLHLRLLARPASPSPRLVVRSYGSAPERLQNLRGGKTRPC